MKKTISTPFPYGSPEDFDQASMEEISRNIREQGIELVEIHDSAHEDYLPFVYTIGLKARSGKELIAFGDDESDLKEIGDLFLSLARRDDAVRPGEHFHEGPRTLIAAIPDSELDDFLQEHCLNEARAYYGVDRVDVLVFVEEGELEQSSGTH
jgi:hypothetical protein